MLTRAQQILIKRAQAEAGLSDADYRQAIADVTGLADCRSSKDGRLMDAHMDHLLSYFEAIFWKGKAVPGKIFREPGFWASRNRRGNTSRDRFTEQDLSARIAGAEAQLEELGFGDGYARAIFRKIVPYSHRAYLAALERTLKAKRRAVAAADCPF
jgi:hypothetical protein